MRPNAARSGPSRARYLVVTLSMLLVIGALVSWHARSVLLAAAVEWVVDRQGLGHAEVEVVAFDLSHVVASVRSSPLGQVPRVEIEYHFGPGLAVTVNRIRITGARLQMAWVEGSLEPAIAFGDGAPATPPPLEVVLQDCVLGLHVEDTYVVASVSGALHGGAQATAELDFRLDAPAGYLRGSLQARTPERDTVAGVVSIDEGDLSWGGWTAAGLRGEAQVHLRQQTLDTATAHLASGQLRSHGQDWGAARLHATRAQGAGWTLALESRPLNAVLHTHAPAVAGELPFDFDGRFDPPLPSTLLRGVRAAAASLDAKASGHWSLAGGVRGSRMQGELRLRAAELELPQLARLAALDATLACTMADAVLSCRAPREVQATDLTLAPAIAPAGSRLAGRATVTIAARDSLPLFALTHTADEQALAINAVLSLHRSTLLLRAPVDLRLDFAASRVAQPGGAFALYAALEVEPQQGQHSPAAKLDLAGRYSVDLARRALQSVEFDHGALDLPAYRWAIRELRASYRDGATRTLELGAGKVLSTASPPWHAPLAAVLSADATADRLQLRATVQDAGKRLKATVEASHRRRDGAGQARFRLHPLRLEGPPALGELAPALAAGLSGFGGELSAAGELAWGAGPLSSKLSVALHDVELASTTFKVHDLHADLRFDSLVPLHSPSGQRLRAEFELPALKRVPLTAEFSVADGRLHIEQARTELFDGAFDLRDGEVELASGATRIALDVVDVNLEAALAVLNIADLSGSGRLSGRLPLRFEGGRIAVDQGHLEARGEGVVKVGTRALSEQLQAHGPDVEQAFRALADFHYTHLGIDAHKPLLGAGRAQLRLEGSNPAVMDNQPFVFNISLETDFDRLAALLLQLSGAASSVLGWGASELVTP